MILMLELLLDKLVPIERSLNWENSKYKTKEQIKISFFLITILDLLQDEMDENNEMSTLDILIK